MYELIYDSEMGPFHSRVGRNIDYEPQLNRKPAGGLRFPHLAGRYLCGRCPIFVPELLEFYIYGRTSDPGDGRYRPRVKRNLAFVSKGNSNRALAP